MMTRTFDDLLRDAAPTPPDPGPSRRHLRTILHDRRRTVERRSLRRHRWGVALTAVLTFVMVFGSQQELGSDGFEFSRTGTMRINHEVSYQVVESPVRGVVGAVAPDWTDAAVRDFQEISAGGGNRAERLTGWAVDDASIFWQVEYSGVADGKPFTSGREPADLSVPQGPRDRRIVPFMMNDGEDFLALVAGGALPGHPVGQVWADGIIFVVTAYSLTYPEHGTITFYRGFPASRR